MNAELNDLKALLFTILEGAYVAPDVNAVQQMGVNMSNSVKREGVVIIQNQNVEVFARLIPQLVQALRLCDTMAQAQPQHVIDIEPIERIELGHRQIEAPTDGPVEACCAWLYDNAVGWQAMQDLMKAHYLSYVRSKLSTNIGAARMLGIQPTYLSKIAKQMSQTPNQSKEAP
jgi:hypothetical protein